MMPASQPPPLEGEEVGSSLDRFLAKRALVLMGYGGGKAASMINFGVAGLMAGISAVMVVISFATQDPGVLAAMVGPLTAGVINGLVGWRMRAYGQKTEASDVRLTTEAKDLLSRWIRNAYGWRIPSLSNGAAAGRVARRAAFGGFGPPRRTVKEFVDANLFAVMENLAHHYNRIHGVVAALKDDRSASTTRLRQGLALAADEAMADSLHQAALYDAYPESGRAYLDALQAQINALGELADKSELLQRRHLEQQLGPASNTALESALEDLRLNELAHQELAVREESRSDQENKT